MTRNKNTHEITSCVRCMWHFVPHSDLLAMEGYLGQNSTSNIEQSTCIIHHHITLLFILYSFFLINHSTFIIQRSSLYLHQSVRGGAILGQLKHLDSTCTRFLDLLMRHFVPVLIGGICLSKNCTHIINIQHSWHTLPCHKRTRDNLGDISWVHNSSNYPWWPEQMEPIR